MKSIYKNNKNNENIENNFKANNSNIMSKKKYILIALVILILTIVLVLVLFNNAKNKKKIDNKNESELILEKGSTSLASKERYELILIELEKRETLIIEKDKLKDKEEKTNAKILALEKEGIKTDILETVYRLKEKELLLGDDLLIEDKDAGEYILKIGKLKDKTFSYELRIKNVPEILKAEKLIQSTELLIPLEEYNKKLKQEKEKEEQNNNEEDEDKTDNEEEDNSEEKEE